MGTKQDRVQFCAHASDPRIDIISQIQGSHDLTIIGESESAPEDSIAVFTAPATLELTNTACRYIAETQLDTPEFSWTRTARNRIALSPVLLAPELTFELNRVEKDFRVKADEKAYTGRRGW